MVTIARRYLTTYSYSDSEILASAVEIVAQHGNQDDSLILFEIAKNSYSDMNRIAATGALRLDKNNEMKIIEKFLQSKDAMFVGMVLKHCFENAIQLNLDEVKAMLYIDNTEIRTYVLAYLTNILSETELEQLLAEYSSAGGYYYNVITWLDRWLYAPKELQGSFQEELKACILSIS